MVAGRNWLTTLYPASYKGVPFETERDEEDGGRRIVIHEFPMRDFPFNEDLGEAKREFEITAYVASDRADSDAAALVAVCTQRGAGVLVLPSHGPILVQCLTIKRSREKDRAGKIALTGKFVREGASSALVSFASLANLVFVAADAVVAALPAFLQAAITALAQPDFVIEAATDAVQDGTAMLEAVRSSANVDPVVSGVQRDAIQALYDAAPSTVDDETGVDGATISGLVTIARALGDGMTGNAAITAFAPMLIEAAVTPRSIYLSAAAQIADENRLAVYMATRLAAATAFAEGIASADIPDRHAAITLRADVAEYFEAILDDLSANAAGIYVAVVNLRDAAIEYLSRAILDRAPVVSVGANMRMPSLWWAHRLYQDPTRSTELVARNRVPHPSFMPQEFEALSR
jgi:prophage DNA circulation protein